MSKKPQGMQRYEDERALIYSVLWIAAAVVLELFVFFINRYYINFKLTMEAIDLASTLSTVLHTGRYVGLMVAGVGVIVALLFARKERSIIIPVIISIAGVAFAVCAHVAVTYQESGIRMLYLLVPAWGAIAVIYYLYQTEFFLSAVAGCFGAMGLWFVRVSGIGIESGMTIVACVIVLAVVCLLKKTNGKVGTVQFVAPDVDYTLTLLSAGIGIILPFVGLAVGAVLSHYLIYLVAAWVFGLLVYYTVKMM